MKKPFVLLTAAFVFLAALFFSPMAFGQLYGDKKDVTKGDLNDQDFWWSKYDDMMLDLAVRQHQPEGRIGIQLASQSRRLDDLLKKYPNHMDIRAMKQHALEVEKGINPNASRGTSFGPDCPWEESNFAQIWVNLHWVKASWEEKDYRNVQSLLQNINQNLEIMLIPERMKSYPPELSKYVREAKPEAALWTQMVNDKLTTPSGPAIKGELSVTSGDLNNQDYWWARFDDLMLDVALKNRQPEGRIDLQLVGAIKRLDDLLKQYPKHEGLLRMKQHAEDIKSKIDPKANRNLAFAPEVPWEESNFAQLWVNLHHAQTAHAKKDERTAGGLLSNIRQNQEILLKPDRMKEYPPELKKWVEGSQAEYDLLAAELKRRR